jgi:outer membrane protein assembly factor BamB
MILVHRFVPLLVASVLVLGLSIATPAIGGDWPRFRGPNGAGVSTDEKAPPTEWSETKNLKWKFELPGPGLSCPIVVGNKIVLTCWSGYGTPGARDAKQADLKLHLVCVDRQTGDKLWTTTIDPVLPEDQYRGMFTENGYASHTPASDGKNIYAFFGKTGVVAFDMDGNKLWQTKVGKDSDPRGWGTASSPILYKNLVIVTASIESRTILALDKETGKEVWKQPADGLASMWGTPILVEVDKDRTDLVIGVPYEIWGFNPENGKLRWFCEAAETDSMCSSVIANDGVVYSIEGRSGGSIAVRAGGTDDVTKSHVVWSGRDKGRICTPVYHDGRLYWVTGGVANCIDAKTGQRVYQARLKAAAGGADAAPLDEQRPPGGRRGGPGGAPGGGFGGGGRGGQDYASPVVAQGRMYFVNRSGEMHVVELGQEFKVLAVNRVSPESDESIFNSTPAISDGALFIRSSSALYCISEEPRLAKN